MHLSATWLQPDEWSAIWAFCTLVVAVIAAAIALLQFSHYIRERSEAARPYLVVDYHFRSILMAVEVSNTSGSVATNVRLRVEPPIQSTDSKRTEVLGRVFSDAYSIKQLSPGRAIRWTLDRTPDYISKGMPTNYTVTVTYDDPRALRRSWWRFWAPKLPKSYTETFDLNIEQWSDANADTDYDNKMWNIANRNESQIKKIASAVEKIANKK